MCHKWSRSCLPFRSTWVHHLVFCGVHVIQSLVLYECFIDCCLSFSTLSFGHCVFCSSSIYGFWLPLWYLQTLLVIWSPCSICRFTYDMYHFFAHLKKDNYIYLFVFICIYLYLFVFICIYLRILVSNIISIVDNVHLTVTLRMILVGKESLILPRAPEFIPAFYFSGIHVVQY